MNMSRIGNYRWFICGLLFFATTVNYLDRQVISLLKPELERQYNWSEIDYSHIVFAFQLAYALGYLLAGRMMDRIGVRRGFTLVVAVWSAAAMAHGLVGPLVQFGLPWINGLLEGTLIGAMTGTTLSVAGFAVARFALGLSEGGNFPGSIKTVGEWFPKKERALATGIFNSGANIGAIVTPLAVPWITLRWGWPAAFYATGGTGFLWLLLWLLNYRNPQSHPRVSAAELAYIESDPPDPPVRIPWLKLLRYRQTWAYAAATLLTSPVWWFYLFWLPSFLHDRHGIDLKTIGGPLLTVYMMASVGSVAGGWLSSWLIKRGRSINFARKTALLACALCVVPVCMASQVSDMSLAVVLIGLAAAAHQGFSANLYTIVSDTFPRKAVSSVVGIGGTAGAIGGMFVAELVGYILDWTARAYGTKQYLVLFVMAASAYLVALGIIQLLLPRLEVATFDEVQG
jgi:MFS transporter, ACS family, hexuronate transporter